ncbi:asparaginase [Salipaludibacillus sp. HK11]|uniref:asparaginase n=1 Tax=Salipaludibacillus sp. HK11 TaxID=3394320 RepID=UPI0039FD5057
MKKVAVLTTGGTIASKPNKNGRLESGIFTGEELSDLVGIPKDIEVHIYSILQKPSIHISFDDLDELKEKIEKLTFEEKIDGIVITHGTDTMEETAYYLDLTLDVKIPVVLTGSQRSPEELGSDANINLRHAIYAAGDSQLNGIGVTVVFNERIFSAIHVKKEHASNIQGFNSFGFGYLGIIDNNKIHVYQKPVKSEYYKVKPKKSITVDIIKCYLESDGKFITACVDAGVNGIVLEGVGRGQVSPSMIAAIQKAIDRGIKIVITTSAEEGEVYPTYDYNGSAYDLYKRGVVLGKDYDSKKARIKLMVCLKSNSDVNAAFER